jgi:CDP-diacylglycerol pyrophosphatase
LRRNLVGAIVAATIALRAWLKTKAVYTSAYRLPRESGGPGQPFGPLPLDSSFRGNDEEGEELVENSGFTLGQAVKLARAFFQYGAAIAIVLAGAARSGQAANPDALWNIVHGQCAPDQQQKGDPAPCAFVDLREGDARGYVVLKDIVGATQYLLIPTARMPGIESPLLIAPGAPNYFADAWRARSYTERAAGRPLPRQVISLAVNSAFGRSQSQLHIHIDCIGSDVKAALQRQLAAIGDSWTPLPEPLVGHRYRAMRVLSDALDGTNPFLLLADGDPGGRRAMGEYTLVVVGAEFAGGRPGFIILTDRVDLATGDRASGEELQDHGCTLALSQTGRDG